MGYIVSVYNNSDYRLFLWYIHSKMSSVKVAVRVRPFNSRELGLNSELIINMKDKTTCKFTADTRHTQNLCIRVHDCQSKSSH